MECTNCCSPRSDVECNDMEKAPILDEYTPAHVPDKLTEEKPPAAAAWRERAWESCRCCRCCCRCCCTGCLGCAMLYGIVLLILALATLGVHVTCAVEDYALSEVPGKALKVGTRSNVIGETWPRSKLDLTGLWWLRWNRADSFSTWFYDQLRMEIMITFADSYMEGGVPEGHFPSLLRVPGAEPHHWGYSNSFPSGFTMWGHANNWRPTTRLGFDFKNDSFARVLAIGDFVKINEDQWLRPNYDNTINYVLTRVVREDGSKHPVWWPQLENLMWWYKLRVWGDSSKCKRRCEVAAGFLLVPRALGCKLCAKSCEADSASGTKVIVSG